MQGDNTLLQIWTSEVFEFLKMRFIILPTCDSLQPKVKQQIFSSFFPLWCETRNNQFFHLFPVRFSIFWVVPHELCFDLESSACFDFNQFVDSSVGETKLLSSSSGSYNIKKIGVNFHQKNSFLINLRNYVEKTKKFLSFKSQTFALRRVHLYAKHTETLNCTNLYF